MSEEKINGWKIVAIRYPILLLILLIKNESDDLIFQKYLGDSLKCLIEGSLKTYTFNTRTVEAAVGKPLSSRTSRLHRATLFQKSNQPNKQTKI